MRLLTRQQSTGLQTIDKLLSDQVRGDSVLRRWTLCRLTTASFKRRLKSHFSDLQFQLHDVATFRHILLTSVRSGADHIRTSDRARPGREKSPPYMVVYTLYTG